MKKLIFFCVFLANLAHAEEWLEGRNDAGGKLILMQTKCEDKPDKSGRLILGTSSNGKTIRGCWYLFTDMIHVVWFDGTTYSYPKEMFVYRRNDQ